MTKQLRFQHSSFWHGAITSQENPPSECFGAASLIRSQTCIFGSRPGGSLTGNEMPV